MGERNMPGEGSCATGNLAREAAAARSPFRPSRPPVSRWHFTTSRPRSAESGVCLKLRNSLMHGPFPRMHAGFPPMRAPSPGLRRPFAGIRRPFARMNDALEGMQRSLGCLGRSLARCAGRNDARQCASRPQKAREYGHFARARRRVAREIGFCLAIRAWGKRGALQPDLAGRILNTKNTKSTKKSSALRVLRALRV